MVAKILGVLILFSAALSSGVYLASVHQEKPAATSLVAEVLPPPLLSEEVPTHVIREQALALNLTATLGKEVAEAIGAQNPTGPQNLGGVQSITTLAPERIAETFLDENFSTAIAENFNPLIEDASLRIHEGKSTKDFSAYALSLQATLVKYNPAIQTALKNPSASTLTKLGPLYEEMITAVKNISVPRPLLYIHREEIRLLTIQKNIFMSIANYEQDPTLAWAAIELIKPVSEEFVALAERIGQVISTSATTHP